MSLRSVRVLFAAAAALSGPFLAAQTAPAAPPAAPAPPPATTTDTDNTGTKVTALEQYTVTDVPVNEQILPTVRPVGSVLGDDMSIIDVPRSVTTRSTRPGCRTGRSPMRWTSGNSRPGVYSPARYGVPATPVIRGDNAQIYVDGQQTLYTLESVLPSFNGVEAMDIVKGPGSAVYGPQSQAPGGYANLVTKEPFFDGQHTEFDSTIGSSTSGHSYFNPEFTIDTGGPLSSTTAYRVSYLSRYGDNYYQNDPNQTQDLFLALASHPSSQALTFDWWGQWYSNYFEDVTGVNRLTQQFIWNGTYIGGSGGAPSRHAALRRRRGGRLLRRPRSGHGLHGQAAGLQGPDGAGRLGPHRPLADPAGHDPRIQRRTTLVNLTYLESANDRELNQLGYDEYMPVQESAQDRLEYHGVFGEGDVQNSLIAGAEFRYTRIVAYQDYAIDAVLLLRPLPALLDLPLPGLRRGRKHAWAAATRCPAPPATAPISPAMPRTRTRTSTTRRPLPRTTSAWAATSRGARLAGRPHQGRRRESRPDPGDGSDHRDHLQSRADGATAGSLYYATGSVNDPSYFASLSYKPTDTASFYITYNHVNSVAGLGQFRRGQRQPARLGQLPLRAARATTISS